MRIDLSPDVIKMLVLAIRFAERYSADFEYFDRCKFYECVYKSPDFPHIAPEFLHPLTVPAPDYCSFKRYFDNF